MGELLQAFGIMAFVGAIFLWAAWHFLSPTEIAAEDVESGAPEGAMSRDEANLWTDEVA